VLAGDLNATLDHSPLRAALRSCADAADRVGAGGTATWPSSSPRWAGVAIDHVLVPPAAGVTGFAVTNLPGSDHRAVLATVRLP
jgi:endonuclease/exonuclease/phosphatase (EEP) superfamily protein YafD